MVREAIRGRCSRAVAAASLTEDCPGGHSGPSFKLTKYQGLVAAIGHAVPHVDIHFGMLCSGM